MGSKKVEEAMKTTMLCAVASLLSAGVLMGGCMADSGSESEGVAAEGPTVGGSEEVGEAQQALTSVLLPLGANSNFEFEIGPSNNLYVIIKAGTGSGKTELHVLTAASNYQTFSVHTATAFGPTDASWEFEVDKVNGDLYGIAKAGTGSGATELHVLSASSNWQAFTVHTATAFGSYLPLSDFKWQLAANHDLFLIDKRYTQVHAASAASNWQAFNVHATSALGPTNSAQWDFDLNASRNVIGLAKYGTGTGTTEVHSLSAATNYASFAFQTGTELPLADDSWVYDTTSDCKLFGIKRWGTPSGLAELKITQLSGAACGTTACFMYKGTNIAGGLNVYQACGHTGSWVSSLYPGYPSYQEPFLDGARPWNGNWASTNNYPVTSTTSAAVRDSFISGAYLYGDCSTCVQ
jgi:hypothetical protein